jgi:uncharacterized protein YfaP (DUF2135 family)
VGTGNLRFTVTWNVPGDIDLWVRTPNGKVISYMNVGPSATTDFGNLDADDTSGTGPENVFWSSAYTPPRGTYVVCVNPYSLRGQTTYTLTVSQPGQTDRIFTGSYGSNQRISDCTVGSATYAATITY